MLIALVLSVTTSFSSSSHCMKGSTYGTREDKRIKYTGNANLHAGSNGIVLLSVAMGLSVRSITAFSHYLSSLSYRVLQNQLPTALLVAVAECRGHYELWSTGVQGPVVLQGLDEGNKDLTWQRWSYQVGLKGETLNLNSIEGTSSVEWMSGLLAVHDQ